jgi:hypothetical protein
MPPRRRSPLLQDLKELAWAVLLLDMILLGVGALLATYLGRLGMLLGIAFAAVTTAAMALAAAGNLLVIAVFKRRRW